MKKIALYSLLIGAGMLMTACSEDYKDWEDPEYNPQPEAITVNITATPAAAINIPSETADSVQIFVPTIKINRDGAVTNFDVAIYNGTKTDSIVITAAQNGKARTSDVQGAFLALFGPEEVARTATANLTAHTLVAGTMVTNYVEGVQIVATPKYQDLPPVWYMLGNCIGRGTWVNNRVMGLYTSLVAMYPNPQNYDELIYASYFPEGTEFQIILEPGNKDNIFCADAAGNIIKSETRPDGATTKNIGVPAAGYYKVTANVVNMTVTMTPITTTVVLLNSLKMGDIALGPVTTATIGENHDWVGDANFAADGTVTFSGASDTKEYTWGGTSFPAGKASIGGSPVPCKTGSYKIVFNDLLGVYSFIAK